MARDTLVPATVSELARLRTALEVSGHFAGPEELAEVVRSEPWRLQVNARGDVVVLDRWRDHLDLLAIEAMWCAERRIPALVRQVRAIVDPLGFSGLVSPVVPVEQAYAYEAAGMTVAEVIVSWDLDPHTAGPAAPDSVPEGVRLRPGNETDVLAVLGVDAEGFDPFWGYDERRLRRLVGIQRLVIAEESGVPIGYTLSTVDRDLGQLGRLCVVPRARRRGVGHALVAEAIGSAARHGARRLALCTQADNVAAAGLYRRAGFRETAGRSVLLRSG